MLVTFSLVALALSSTAFASPRRRHHGKGATCRDFIIPVTASATQIVLPTQVDPQDPLGFIFTLDPSQITFQQVNGTWDIAARYCEPANFVPGRSDTLQILGHGNTYDKTYWAGLGFPGFNGDQYSWMAYASQQGYPTLTMDRLGNGDSSHPDPMNTVQSPIQVEILHQIVSMARAGKLLKQIKRSFGKIVYVGHSYGSFLGNGLSAKYPGDVDAYVLTGMTNQPPQIAFPGILANAQYLPAALVNPARFGNLPLGYLTGANKAGRETVYYSKPKDDFDPQIFELDWNTAGTATIGEAVTTSTTTATNYHGSVFILTGDHDTIFCGHGTGGDDADCGQGSSSLLAQTKDLYPNVQNFDFFAPANAGHDWNLHFSAPDGFKVAHDWLSTVV